MLQHDRDRTAQLASKHGIEVDPHSLTGNDSGLDFQVVFAQDRDANRWILRIPRRHDVLPRATVERNALTVMRGLVSFEIPHWEVFEDDLIAYRALNGVPAGRFTMATRDYVWGDGETEVPHQFTASLATVMAELHQLPRDVAENADLAVEEASDLQDRMDRRMNHVREVFGVEDSLWGRWQSWIDNDEMWPQGAGLVHGDLHPGHMLVNSEAEVTGLIDWTEAKIADVSNDFVYHYMAFGEKELSKLISLYRSAGGQTWPLMKDHVIEIMAAFPIQIAEFAIATQAEDHENMARELLGVT